MSTEKETGLSPGLLPLFEARKKGRKPAKIDLEGVTRMLKGENIVQEAEWGKRNQLLNALENWESTFGCGNVEVSSALNENCVSSKAYIQWVHARLGEQCGQPIMSLVSKGDLRNGTIIWDKLLSTTGCAF